MIINLLENTLYSFTVLQLFNFYITIPRCKHKEIFGNDIVLDPKIVGLRLHAFDKTNGSHVMVYNPDYYGNLYLNDMSEYYPNR